MSVLVIAEHDNQIVKPATLNTINAAMAFSDDCRVLVTGHQADAVVEELSVIKGVAEVIYLAHERFDHFIAEDIVESALNYAKDSDVVLAPATTYGKNVLPRLAALLDVAQHSDVIAIKDKDTFVRPIYAGNVLLTVKALDEKKVISIRPTAFPAQPKDDTKAKITRVEASLDNPLSSYVSSEISKQERSELADARIVVSGGRGLGDAEKFKLIEEFADSIGAAIGASRAAVDAGFIANDFQVGQTGKVVAPELYIAVGISGAIQHLAGMKDSKIIVAINKDADAPIFKIATYGLVGDLFEIVPELIKKLGA